VAPPSAIDLEQLYAERILLESLAVKLSSAHLTTEELAQLESLLEEMSGAVALQNVELWEVPHRQYHDLLRKYAGMKLIERARDLDDHAERYRRLYMSQPQSWASAAQEHREIVDACKARNSALAAAQLGRHLGKTALVVAASISPEHEPAAVRAALRLVGAISEEQGPVAIR
jgi:DNA-binding GntR family transcriptional regulator